MHRALPLLLLPMVAMAQKKPDLDALFEKHTFTKGDASLNYRMMTPPKVEGKKTYPLVVFLHGAGERGDDNAAQLKHGAAEFAKASTRKKHPCYVIAPQCPEKGWWAGRFRGKEMPGSGPLVLELIDKLCQELPIDKKRIYITGLSMGGFGSWALMAQRPELFAAGIPICGGGDEKAAGKLAKIPIWAFHGDEDKAVKGDLSRAMVKAIEKAGGKPKYTEYEGVGHDSWTQTYKNPEVIDWLFAQKKE
ncbi:MAG: prolyl oligopeptidase family serine peptidase [Gemmataceae bacterium]